MKQVKTARRWIGATLLLGSAVALSGCHIDMWDQPKMKAYYESDFFGDRSELRPVIPNTVAHTGSLSARLDDVYFSGRDAAGKLVPKIPVRAVKSFASPKAMLMRGQDRFNAFCSPCHGYIGDGNGMITQRGLGYWQKLPASYYTDRLRKIEDGYIYDVIVNGHGVMYGYGSRITDINDRWAVVSYIRALQLAHNARPDASAPGGGPVPVDSRGLGVNGAGTQASPIGNSDTGPAGTSVVPGALSTQNNRTTGGGQGAANGAPDSAAPDTSAPLPSPAASKGAQ